LNGRGDNVVPFNGECHWLINLKHPQYDSANNIIMALAMTTAAITAEHVLAQQTACDRIFAMRKTEASYSLQSFLHQQQCTAQEVVPLSDTWRRKVTQWAFNVVDHFGFARDVVTVSMGIFDRYLATKGNLCSGNVVLLTSLTTLNLAIKLHESTQRIKSQILADLSRGQFGTKHIEEMELEILAALSWKLHMPTPLTFVAEFLHFLPSNILPAERKEVYEQAKYLTELAVCESSFVERPNSIVALAAMYNVMETIRSTSLSLEVKENFLRTIAKTTLGQVQYESPSLKATRDRLKTMYSKVSATDCFDSTTHGTQASGYWGQTLAGGRIVTPNGSPSSTASSCYGHYSTASSTGTKHARESSSTKANMFWYTPSPPPTRAGGVKSALLG
jgi:Cyclin, N-terminal domain/Cyclin, C-terminal domain